jgi:hypothetical protein
LSSVTAGPYHAEAQRRKDGPSAARASTTWTPAPISIDKARADDGQLRRMNTWRLAALAGFSLLAGCRERTVCTSEVTAGDGIFKAIVAGTRPQAELERDALASACKQLCSPGKAAENEQACISRCAVDASAGKIGARTTCSKGSR